MVSESDKQLAENVFSDVTDSFHVMLGAREGKLNTPCTITTSAGGSDEAECLGSVRHMAEFIEESDHGYTVEIEELGETEPLPSQDVRFAYRLTIREADGGAGSAIERSESAGGGQE